MRRLILLPLLALALFCVLATSLVGCGSYTSAVPVQPGSPPLTAVNWKNFTYYSACYADKPRAFSVKNGEGVVNGVHLQVYKPVFGDLTGDGQPEAAIPYNCFAADSWGERVFVYGGNANKPVLLGDLPLPPPDTNYTVQAVTIANGVIQLVGLGYSASAPHCCPDLHVKNSYRWNGTRFVRVSSQVTKI